MTHEPPYDDDFYIGPNDTIIVLREDGTCDASFPELEEEEHVAPHIMTTAAIMYALEDQELCDKIHESFAQTCEDFVFMDAVNDN